MKVSVMMRVFLLNLLRGGIERVTNADFKRTTPALPYQHIRHTKLASDNNFKIGNNRLSLNVGWQRNQREEFGNPDNINERALYFDPKDKPTQPVFILKERKWLEKFHWCKME